MFRNKPTLIAFLLVLSATTWMLAQNLSGPPDPATRIQHRVEFLTRELNLTPAQQQSATTIFTNAENSSKTVHDSMKAAHQTLSTAVKNNDSNGITQAAATIGNLTAQMVETEAKARAALYQTLTPDQQAKFNDFASHHMGPGGHGMFPARHP